MAQVINELLKQGFNPVSILRVNLEEPLFSNRKFHRSPGTDLSGIPGEDLAGREVLDIS